MDKLLNQQLISKGFCFGQAAIQIDREHFEYGEYVYNAENDGWFRRLSGTGKGYGLCITKFKVTGKSNYKLSTGEYTCYPVIFEFLSSNGEIEKAKSFLFVHDSTDVDTVTKYILENMENWRP